MAKEHAGTIDASGMKLAIIAARFNGAIVSNLVEGATDAFTRTGGNGDHIDIYRVPGAFELTQAATRIAGTGRHDLIVCLGVVIRGATPHFDYICSSVTRGLTQLAATASAAVTYGVLTCDTIEQAVERAGTKAGNKGFDATMGAIEMAQLLRHIES